MSIFEQLGISEDEDDEDEDDDFIDDEEDSSEFIGDYEDEENFAMLDDFDDSIIDLCHTIMQLVIEGEIPNDLRVLQKVYDKLKDTPLPPSELTLFHEVVDKINKL